MPSRKRKSEEAPAEDEAAVSEQTPTTGTAPVQFNVNITQPAARAASTQQPPATPTPPPDDEDDDEDDVRDDLSRAALVDDLLSAAAEEAEEEEQLDPYSAFIAKFSDGKSYRFNLTRLPDPAEHEGEFLVPCIADKHYPSLPFRPEHLISDILRKTKSGGKVRVQLFLHGSYVRGGSLTFIVDNPDEETPPAVAHQEPPPPPVAPPVVRPEEQSNGRRALADRLLERLEEVVFNDLESKIKGEDKRQESQPAERPQLDPETELTLSIIRNTQLLPNVISSITSAVAAAAQGNTQQSNWADKAWGVFERNPALQTRAVKTVDRILDRFLPEKENGDGNGDGDDYNGDDQEHTMTTQQRRIELLNYICSMCAEGKAVTFDDAQIKAFAEAEPGEWNELLDSLATYPAAAIIAHVSQFGAIYKSVLNQPKSKVWVEKYMISPAKRLRAAGQ